MISLSTMFFVSSLIYPLGAYLFTNLDSIIYQGYYFQNNKKYYFLLLAPLKLSYLLS